MTMLMEGTTDSEGRFLFERVPPVVVQLELPHAGIQSGLEVQPGETALVTLGGPGRKVVGQLRAPEASRPASIGMLTQGTVRQKPPALALFPTVRQREAWDEKCKKLSAYTSSSSRMAGSRSNTFPRAIMS